MCVECGFSHFLVERKEGLFCDECPKKCSSCTNLLKCTDCKGFYKLSNDQCVYNSNIILIILGLVLVPVISCIVYKYLTSRKATEAGKKEQTVIAPETAIRPANLECPSSIEGKIGQSEDVGYLKGSRLTLKDNRLKVDQSVDKISSGMRAT